MKNKITTGIYIHYPFCLAKCPYCDFNSEVNKDIKSEEILSTFIRDLNHYHSLIGSREIDTIYFGGGTPSLMSPKMIKNILNEIKNLFKVKDNAEITLEANPLTAEVQKFEEFKKAGINRLSIGIQSFSKKGLKTLGRSHNLKQAKNALNIANSIFSRSSFDLIYGWPGQTLEEWKKELQEAITYENGHLSIYQLTVYNNTPFGKAKTKEISSRKALQFENKTKEILSKNNIEQYEISNYAKKGQESRHNLIYWHYDDYIGIGPGASGRLTINNNKYSFFNTKNISEWLEHLDINKTLLSSNDQFEEYLLMGLRLNQGINIKDFKKKTKIDLHKLMQNKGYLKEFITIKNGYLKATEKGLNCLDTLISKLI